MSDHICFYTKDMEKDGMSYYCECGSKMKIESDGTLEVEHPDTLNGLEDLEEGTTVSLGNLTYTKPTLERELELANECLRFWTRKVTELNNKLGGQQ